jgi:hypothetical protein
MRGSSDFWADSPDFGGIGLTLAEDTLPAGNDMARRGFVHFDAFTKHGPDRRLGTKRTLKPAAAFPGGFPLAFAQRQALLTRFNWH